MTTISKLSLRGSKIYWMVAGIIGAVIGLIAFAFGRQTKAVVAILVFYAVVTTIFLLAQVVAFVLSHAYYSEEIEEPKFKMIENEEKEWRTLA